MTGHHSNETLIDSLLAEQRSLTAVERFSRTHDLHTIPAHKKNYRSLLPASSPKPGQQYAFEVNLDQCSGCKACVTACHSLNGLDETETWRSVGLLVHQPSTNNYQLVQQHVTTACHHCADPGCANGCPVLAYDKDPVTGIVRHLDDQCIGCSYCVMKCPYEVPKYSDRLGIVRKCDMCSQRLAVGEAPACVQACPNEAIKITLVETQSAINFLPDSPDPRITLPTTRFLSAKLPHDLVAADHAAPRLDHAHWPLVIMLVLTQASAGMFLMATIAHANGVSIKPLAITAFAVLNIGLVASVLHLGQPLKAWRAFLGWRKSWLSREIIAFNAFAGAALLTILHPPFSILAAALGLIAVAVSAMVYVDTKRPFWSPRLAFGNFFGTTLLLGATFSAVVFGGSGQLEIGKKFAIAALMFFTIIFIWRRLEFVRAFRNPQSPIHLNTRTLSELLPHLLSFRAALFFSATALGVMAIVNTAGLGVVWGSIAALLALTLEIVSRYIFFVASASKRMPGGFAA